MEFIDSDRLNRAEGCMWRSARLLERLRFAQLFRGGSDAAVLTALTAYQNADGGFGHAIEPDFRGPISQPLGSEFALHVLSELTPPPRLLDDCVRYLQSITVADGGVPNVLPSARAFPRAPWWEPASETPPGSLLPTAAVAGRLYALGRQDAWLARATEFCWPALERLLSRAARARERLERLFVAYEARAAIPFLDHVPDRSRAQRMADELGGALHAARLLAIEPDVSAEAAQPLEFAALPSSLAAAWFAPQLIEQHLDAWVLAQAQDGGWDVPWLIWTPVTQGEWRGIQTLQRLQTLRAWGRFRHYDLD